MTEGIITAEDQREGVITTGRAIITTMTTGTAGITGAGNIEHHTGVIHSIKIRVQNFFLQMILLIPENLKKSPLFIE